MVNTKSKKELFPHPIYVDYTSNNERSYMESLRLGLTFWVWFPSLFFKILRNFLVDIWDAVQIILWSVGYLIFMLCLFVFILVTTPFLGLFNRVRMKSKEEIPIDSPLNDLYND